MVLLKALTIIPAWILHLNYQLVLHLIELNMDQIISVIKLSMEAKEHQLKSPQFSFIGTVAEAVQISKANINLSLRFKTASGSHTSLEHS